MNNQHKVRLGFCMAVMAFCLTIIVSQSEGFQEFNPVLALLFNDFNTYQVIVAYTFMWGVIFTLYSYVEDKVSVYQVNYIANIILLVGFFDILHDAIMIAMYIL
jgi:hypothetical protein